MTHLEVKYGTVIDATGKKRTGHIVFENGIPSYPFATQDQAIKFAESVAQIRKVGGVVAKVHVDGSTPR